MILTDKNNQKILVNLLRKSTAGSYGGAAGAVRDGPTDKPSFSEPGGKGQKVQGIWNCDEYGLARRGVDPLASSKMREE